MYDSFKSFIYFLFSFCIMFLDLKTKTKKPQNSLLLYLIFVYLTF